MSEALVLLVLLWAALLIPSALRSRGTSPHATVGGFERAMSVLRNETHGARDDRGVGRRVLVPGDAGRIVDRPPAAGGPGGSGAPQQPGEPGLPEGPARAARRHEDPVIVRRRLWFVRSLLATTSLLLLAVVVGGWLWLPALAVTGLTAGYVVTLRRLKLQHDEARRVVRELELDRGRVEPEHRVAVGDHAPSGTVRLRRWDD